MVLDNMPTVRSIVFDREHVPYMKGAGAFASEPDRVVAVAKCKVFIFANGQIGKVDIDFSSVKKTLEIVQDRLSPPMDLGVHGARHDRTATIVVSYHPLGVAVSHRPGPTF